MMHPDNVPRCVVVDGSIAIVRALEVILTGLGWEAKATAFAGNAMVEVLRAPTSLLITGLKPSNGCGLRLILMLRQRGWTGRVVILTARPERVAPSVLRSLEIAAVLKKPFKLERLRAVVEQEIGKKVQQETNERGAGEEPRKRPICERGGGGPLIFRALGNASQQRAWRSQACLVHLRCSASAQGNTGIWSLLPIGRRLAHE